MRTSRETNEQSPLTLPGVDILCCGASGTTSRLGALVNALCMMRDHDKCFPVSRIVVVLPAFSEKPIETEETQLRAGVAAVRTHLHGKQVTTWQEGFLKGLGWFTAVTASPWPLQRAGELPIALSVTRQLGQFQRLQSWLSSAIHF
jgi:hypothetical protein